jgi:hypothetical protein
MSVVGGNFTVASNGVVEFTEQVMITVPSAVFQDCSVTAPTVTVSANGTVTLERSAVGATNLSVSSRSMDVGLGSALTSSELWVTNVAGLVVRGVVRVSGCVVVRASTFELSGTLDTVSHSAVVNITCSSRCDFVSGGVMYPRWLVLEGGEVELSTGLSVLEFMLVHAVSLAVLSPLEVAVGVSRTLTVRAQNVSVVNTNVLASHVDIVCSDMSLFGSARLDTSDRGFAAGEGPGQGASVVLSGRPSANQPCQVGSPGAHAGTIVGFPRTSGFSFSATAKPSAYGSMLWPTAAGSAGGFVDVADYRGHRARSSTTRGGGTVSIVAHQRLSLSAASQIKADGGGSGGYRRVSHYVHYSYAYVSFKSGASSGGSVALRVGELVGGGTISASGGSGVTTDPYCSGYNPAGSGGRIAVHHRNMSAFTGSIAATGGVGGTDVRVVLDSVFDPLFVIFRVKSSLFPRTYLPLMTSLSETPVAVVYLGSYLEVRSGETFMCGLDGVGCSVTGNGVLQFRAGSRFILTGGASGLKFDVSSQLSLPEHGVSVVHTGVCPRWGGHPLNIASHAFVQIQSATMAMETDTVFGVFSGVNVSGCMIGYGSNAVVVPSVTWLHSAPSSFLHCNGTVPVVVRGFKCDLSSRTHTPHQWMDRIVRIRVLVGWPPLALPTSPRVHVSVSSGAKCDLLVGVGYPTGCDATKMVSDVCDPECNVLHCAFDDWACEPPEALYVSPSYGSDNTTTGLVDSPFKTISGAMRAACHGTHHCLPIRLQGGQYSTGHITDVNISVISLGNVSWVLMKNITFSNAAITFSGISFLASLFGGPGGIVIQESDTVTFEHCSFFGTPSTPITLLLQHSEVVFRNCSFQWAFVVVEELSPHEVSAAHCKKCTRVLSRMPCPTCKATMRPLLEIVHSSVQFPDDLWLSMGVNSTVLPFLSVQPGVRVSMKHFHVEGAIVASTLRAESLSTSGVGSLLCLHMATRSLLLQGFILEGVQITSGVIHFVQDTLHFPLNFLESVNVTLSDCMLFYQPSHLVLYVSVASAVGPLRWPLESVPTTRHTITLQGLSVNWDAYSSAGVINSVSLSKLGVSLENSVHASGGTAMLAISSWASVILRGFKCFGVHADDHPSIVITNVSLTCLGCEFMGTQVQLMLQRSSFSCENCAVVDTHALVTTQNNSHFTSIGLNSVRIVACSVQGSLQFAPTTNLTVEIAHTVFYSVSELYRSLVFNSTSLGRMSCIGVNNTFRGLNKTVMGSAVALLATAGGFLSVEFSESMFLNNIGDFGSSIWMECTGLHSVGVLTIVSSYFVNTSARVEGGTLFVAAKNGSTCGLSILHSVFFGCSAPTGGCLALRTDDTAAFIDLKLLSTNLSSYHASVSGGGLVMKGRVRASVADGMFENGVSTKCGALQLLSGSQIDIRGSLFLGHAATIGGVGCLDQSFANFSGCNISVAEAYEGGALYLSGNSVVSLISSVVHQITAAQGVIRALASTLRLNEVLLTQNIGTSKGAAVFASFSSVDILHSSFIGHEALRAVLFVESSQLCMQSSEVLGTSPSWKIGQSDFGAALYCDRNSDCSLTDSIFANNKPFSIQCEGGAKVQTVNSSLMDISCSEQSPILLRLATGMLPLRPTGGTRVRLEGLDLALTAPSPPVNALVLSWPASRVRMGHSWLEFDAPSGWGVNLPLLVYIEGRGLAISDGIRLSYERPIVMSVLPRVLPPRGGNVTIHGRNFGGPSVDLLTVKTVVTSPSGSLVQYVCSELRRVSFAELQCVVQPHVGQRVDLVVLAGPPTFEAVSSKFTMDQVDVPEPPQRIAFQADATQCGVFPSSGTLTWEPPLQDWGRRVTHYRSAVYALWRQ